MKTQSTFTLKHSLKYVLYTLLEQHKWSQQKEQLSLNHYLLLLDKPELTLAVKQRRPKSLDDAAAFTLEGL